MVTTTGTTATTPTAQSISSAAATTLLNSLETGSGVDTTSLVNALVEAQFAARNAQLTRSFETLSAQISGVGTLKSTVASFASALDTLVKGGTLAAQPVSSNTGVLTATALTGAKLSGLASNIAVTQIAAAQTAVSTTAFANASDAIGTGVFTLTFGTATYSGDGSAITAFAAGPAPAVTIAIGAGDSSLTGIAAAINAKKAGVTASVVTDADGAAYLALRGPTGAAQAFTLAATTDTDGTLAALNVGVGASGTTISAAARNAKLTVDGVSIERSSNTISDLISGVKLTLTGTSTIPVALTSTSPTEALTQSVSDFVSAYNEVLAVIAEQTDPVTGPLRTDSAAAALLRSLKGLTLTKLIPNAPAGTPATLAEIGVATNRDGTLRVDTTTLSAALTRSPDAVEALFAFSPNASSGISAVLTRISNNAASTITGLGASNMRYSRAQGEVSERQDALSLEAEKLTTRMTQQFATMNAKVAAYKSTQSFLKQQIDTWTMDNN